LQAVYRRFAAAVTAPSFDVAGDPAGRAPSTRSALRRSAWWWAVSACGPRLRATSRSGKRSAAPRRWSPTSP